MIDQALDFGQDVIKKCDKKGMESVEHYDFCTFTCLQKWVETRVPRIPDTFLEAFRGES